MLPDFALPLVNCPTEIPSSLFSVGTSWRRGGPDIVARVNKERGRALWRHNRAVRPQVIVSPYAVTEPLCLPCGGIESSRRSKNSYLNPLLHQDRQLELELDSRLQLLSDCIQSTVSVQQSSRQVLSLPQPECASPQDRWHRPVLSRSYVPTTSSRPGTSHGTQVSPLRRDQGLLSRPTLQSSFRNAFTNLTASLPLPHSLECPPKGVQT